LKGVSPTSIRIGLVLSFFSFAGFESAASLGDEAKKPLKTIPKAIIISAITVGIFLYYFHI
jgi:amino acid transporter